MDVIQLYQVTWLIFIFSRELEHKLTVHRTERCDSSFFTELLHRCLSACRFPLWSAVAVSWRFVWQLLSCSAAALGLCCEPGCAATLRLTPSAVAGCCALCWNVRKQQRPKSLFLDLGEVQWGLTAEIRRCFLVRKLFFSKVFVFS